jgi:hypothetical protein
LVVLYEQSLSPEEISNKMKIPIDDVKNKIAELKTEDVKIPKKEYKKDETPPLSKENHRRIRRESSF